VVDVRYGRKYLDHFAQHSQAPRASSFTGSATTKSGAAGNEAPLRTAIIPELRFGGAFIRNAVVLVMGDKELDINLGTKGHYVVEGIFGYPVISALGSFTISDDQMEIATASSSSARCSPLYVQDLTPLVVAGSQGEDLTFSFDSGAQYRHTDG